jgi:hypothetical protein
MVKSEPYLHQGATNWVHIANGWEMSWVHQCLLQGVPKSLCQGYKPSRRSISTRKSIQGEFFYTNLHQLRAKLHLQRVENKLKFTWSILAKINLYISNSPCAGYGVKINQLTQNNIIHKKWQQQGLNATSPIWPQITWYDRWWLRS